MADAYVNFYAQLDPRAGQAFRGEATQLHRAASVVGVSAATRTAIALADDTFYCEVKPTSGNVFACIADNAASEATITSKRVRIDQDEKVTLCRNGQGIGNESLFIWAA